MKGRQVLGRGSSSQDPDMSLFKSVLTIWLHIICLTGRKMSLPNCGVSPNKFAYYAATVYMDFILKWYRVLDLFVRASPLCQ